MTQDKLNRIIEGMGYPLDKKTQVSEIKRFVGSTNLYLDNLNDFITFSSDGVINIKKFTAKVVSGRISNNVEIDRDILQYMVSPILRHKAFPFRSPKVGDYIIIFKKDGTIVRDDIEISEIRPTCIKISKNFPIDKFDKENDYICYISHNDYANSYTTNMYRGLFFTYAENTDNEIDISLDTEPVIGIELYNGLSN